MSINCTRCGGTGVLNIEQIPNHILHTSEGDEENTFIAIVLDWMKKNPDSDVSICDCCGNGDEWYGEPGRHYTSQDPVGKNGPYAYNGGLCECH